MDNTDVSIFMLTYNQENFIAQTIESVLMQKTNFNFQLVIGEDCSTDNTRSICEQFAVGNPKIIKLLDSEENLGLIQNFIRTFKKCTGKYVAILDGDDYWIDPFKLQKQFDFLEKNPNFSIVHSNFKYLFPNGDLSNKDTSKIKKVSDFDDLIFENSISSVTAFFRNKQNVEDFPEWIAKFPYGDWPIYLWTINDGGKIGFLEDVTAVYRKEIGISEHLKKNPSAIAKVNLEIVNAVYKDDGFLNKKGIVKKSLEDHTFMIMGCYLREKKISKLLKKTISCFLIDPLKTIKSYSYILKREWKK